MLSGEKNANWKGGKRITSHGYVVIYSPSHPRADVNSTVYEHVLVAEKALGRHLPDGVEIHHVNENTRENVGANLVICENHGYHQLLHARKRAYEATGNPSSRICKYCHEWDRPENMKQYASGGHYHLTCYCAFRDRRRRTDRHVANRITA